MGTREVSGLRTCGDVWRQRTTGPGKARESLSPRAPRGPGWQDSRWAHRGGAGSQDLGHRRGAVGSGSRSWRPFIWAGFSMVRVRRMEHGRVPSAGAGALGAGSCGFLPEGLPGSASSHQR